MSDVRLSTIILAGFAGAAVLLAIEVNPKWFSLALYFSLYSLATMTARRDQ